MLHSAAGRITDPSCSGLHGGRQKQGPGAFGSTRLGAVFQRILRFYDAPECTQCARECNHMRCTAEESRPELEESRGGGLSQGWCPCVIPCGISNFGSAADYAVYGGLRRHPAAHPGETVMGPWGCLAAVHNSRCRFSFQAAGNQHWGRLPGAKGEQELWTRRVPQRWS